MHALDSQSGFLAEMADRARWSVTASKDGDPIETVDMQSPIGLVGCSPECDLVLRDSQVSSHHALLLRLGGRLACVDLGSRIGLRWNGTRQSVCWPANDSTIQVGPYDLLFEFNVTDDAANRYLINPLEEFDRDIGQPPQIGLEFNQPNRSQNVQLIGQHVTLFGRSNLCQVQFEDDSVSRVHCAVLVVPGGAWVVDFGGQDGTKVNGKCVKFEHVEDGAVLGIGRHQVRIHYYSRGGVAISSTASVVDRPPATSGTAQAAASRSANVAYTDDDTADDVRDSESAGRDSRPEFTPQSFLTELLASRLVSRDEIERVVGRDRLAECSLVELQTRLVASKLLTAFQVSRVEQGQGRKLMLEDRYRIVDRLSHGGMASIYLGYDALLGRKVAIKIPRTRKKRILQRFRREGILNGKLDHPNIVRVLDVGRTHGFLVLEFVDGRNLLQVVESDGKLAPPVVVDYMIQVCAALSVAHRLGVIHRDIKPSNVMVTESGVAKLLDLGLARVDESDAMSDREQEAQAGITRIGVKLGTEKYMAPEQAQDSKEADTRSDIYGLGCTMYELLAGRVPFPAKTAVEMLLRHSRDPVEPIEGVDATLMGIVERAMSKSPDERQQTVDEYREELEDWRAQSFASRSRGDLTDESPFSDPEVSLIDTATVDMQRAHDEADRIQSEAAQIRDEAQQLHAAAELSLARATADCEQLVADRVELAAERNLLEAHRDELDVRRRELEEQRTDVEEQKSQLEQQQSEHAELKKQASVLKGQATRAKNELAAVREELDQLRKQLDAESEIQDASDANPK